MATPAGVVARTRSAADGTFTVLLAPGTYTVSAQRVDGLRSRAVETVTVPAPPGTAPLRLTLDSFIR